MITLSKPNACGRKVLDNIVLKKLSFLAQTEFDLGVVVCCLVDKKQSQVKSRTYKNEVPPKLINSFQQGVCRISRLFLIYFYGGLVFREPLLSNIWNVLITLCIFLINCYLTAFMTDNIFIIIIISRDYATGLFLLHGRPFSWTYYMPFQRHNKGYIGNKGYIKETFFCYFVHLHLVYMLQLCLTQFFNLLSYSICLNFLLITDIFMVDADFHHP